MKKITLLFALILTTASFAQLKKINLPVKNTETIGKAQQFGVPLTAELTKTDNVYTLRFRDAEYTHIEKYESFSFEDVDNTFEDLYATIMEGLETQPKEHMMLELPNHFIWLNFKKTLGVPMVSISCTADKSKNTSIYMSNLITKKQIEKLFGKKK